MFHISIATVEDAAEIIALQRLAYEPEARLYNDSSVPPLSQSLESLMSEIRTGTVLKVTEGPSIVGSVRARLAEDICLIGRLMVAPACQGRGLALLHAIEDMFPQVQHFELFTGARSDANLRFCTRHGYVAVGTRPAAADITLVVLRKTRR